MPTVYVAKMMMDLAIGEITQVIHGVGTLVATMIASITAVERSPLHAVLATAIKTFGSPAKKSILPMHTSADSNETLPAQPTAVVASSTKEGTLDSSPHVSNAAS